VQNLWKCSQDTWNSGQLPENTDKNSAQRCLILKNWRPTWGESHETFFSFFLGGHPKTDLCGRKYTKSCASKFREIRAKIFRTPKNLPAPTYVFDNHYHKLPYWLDPFNRNKPTSTMRVVRNNRLSRTPNFPICTVSALFSNGLVFGAYGNRKNRAQRKLKLNEGSVCAKKRKQMIYFTVIRHFHKYCHILAYYVHLLRRGGDIAFATPVGT